VKERILKLARKVARSPKEREHAVVVFEDGSEAWVRGSWRATAIPLYSPAHGRAIAVIHTHPVPRETPSLADLRTLITMSRMRAPAYLATVYRVDGEALVTLYTATRALSPHEAEAVLLGALEYERLHLETGFNRLASEKQAREQHELLKFVGITVERYRLML